MILLKSAKLHAKSTLPMMPMHHRYMYSTKYVGEPNFESSPELGNK